MTYLFLAISLLEHLSVSSFHIACGLQQQFYDRLRGGRANVALGASTKVGGMGIGIGVNKSSQKSAAKGMGSAKSKQAKNKNSNFDVSASMIRLEKLYDQLMKEDSKRMSESSQEEYGSEDIVTTEYVIAARDASQKIVCDWVPIANLCLARSWSDAHSSEGAADPAVRAAMSFFCREIGFVAGLGSRVFTSIPRQNLQYAVEPLDSFYKHVFAAVDGSKESKVSDKTSDEGKMSKQQARETLHLPEDCFDPREIKNMYRKRAFACHPDRLTDLADEDRLKASKEYAQIQLAYETLSSGIKNGATQSWYASLGGRARTDFVGPIELLPIAEAERVLSSIRAAVVGIDPDVVQTFVARTRSNL